MKYPDSLTLTVGRNLALGNPWQSPDDGSDSSSRQHEHDQAFERGILSRKRPRDEILKDVLCTKAGREKIRRDRLNDRFMELGRELGQGTCTKADKAVILNDTLKLLMRLRNETQALTEKNRQLLNQIKELKVEKSELRDEKSRLKVEKERLQAQFQALPVPATGYFTSPAAAAAAAAALQAAAMAAVANQTGVKPPGSIATVPAVTNVSGEPHAPLWSWMPVAAVDTAQDHALRPPVA